jgi:hypothetical protein
MKTHRTRAECPRKALPVVEQGLKIFLPDLTTREEMVLRLG